MREPTSEERKHTNLLLKEVIDPVMNRLNLPYNHPLKMMYLGKIDAQVEQELRSADLVIADLFGSNPNVMYEVGIRLGVERSCIFLIPEGQRSPFDISAYRKIIYPPELEAVDVVKQQLEEQITQGLKTIPPRLLYTRKDIEQFEAGVECGAIWVISPDLQHSSTCPFLKEIVQQNLRQGITYTFIFPETRQTQSVLDNLNQMFADHPGRLIMKPMSKTSFHKMAVSHYLVFVSNGCREEVARVFLELPTGSREYWIEVDRAGALDFYSRFFAVATGERAQKNRGRLRAGQPERAQQEPRKESTAPKSSTL